MTSTVGPHPNAQHTIYGPDDRCPSSRLRITTTAKSVLGGRYCITRGITRGSVPVSERSPEHPSAPRRFVTPSRRESVAGHRSAFGERISGGAGAIADHRWPFPLRDVGTFVPGAACEAVWNDKCGASPFPALPRAGLSGDTPRTAAPGISCRALSFTSSRLSLRTPGRSHFGDESASQSFVLGALSVSRRVSPKVEAQPPGPIVAIARRRDAANRP